MKMEWLWLGLCVVFAIAEASTTALVSVWFIGGSVAAFLAALCGAELWLQVVLFFAVSAALLLTLRPLTKRLTARRQVATNAESNVGKVVLVTETINNLHGTGAVRLSGAEWTARSESGEQIAQGIAVRVVRIESAKVIVTPAENQQ